jgi:hypothetical protein
MPIYVCNLFLLTPPFSFAGFLRNSWWENPYSMSVWAGTNINAYPSLRRAFLVPVQEKVYFAGEWAADKYNG